MNKEKLQFKKEEVSFFGHTSSSQGISLDHKKVNSILEVDFPPDKETMHSFLGLVNFLNRYSSKLTELCAPLRKLILKDVHYNVQDEHRTAFLEIKENFCQKIVLPNPKRDLVQFYSIEFQSILLPGHWLLLSRITRILPESVSVFIYLFVAVI